MQNFTAILCPNDYYHVFNRAVGNEHLFVAETNYRYFLDLFGKYISPVSDLFCYSILPNHFHFFLRMKETSGICRRMEDINYRHGSEAALIPRFLLQQFSNCFNAYTKSFNKQQKRMGKLFMEPFNRKSITTPEYYTRLIHYIHANPVHHGLCNRIVQWPYSSYHEIISGRNSWIQHAEIVKWFGSIEEFKRFHAQPIHRKFA